MALREVRVDANDLIFRAKADIEKIVRKCTPTSGAIYLHKDFIGKKFRVILIPLDKEPTVSEETKKAEEGLGVLKEGLAELKK